MTTQSKAKGEYDVELNRYFWDLQEPSDVTFIAGNAESIQHIGELKSAHPPYDDCGDACDDWYGNTRPIFIGDRIFALSGDELIEARLNENSDIVEISRLVFTD